MRAIKTGMIAAALMVAAGGAAAHTTGSPSGVIDLIGRFHPMLVHFPVALILTAGVAELLYGVRKDRYFGTAAIFLVTAGSWMAMPTFLVGFAAAAGEAFDPGLDGVFAVHRIVGITTPMLAFMAAGLGHSARRSGQVWEQMVYRVFLFLAAMSVALAGFYGGRLVYGLDYLPF